MVLNIVLNRVIIASVRDICLLSSCEDEKGVHIVNTKGR